MEPLTRRAALLEFAAVTAAGWGLAPTVARARSFTHAATFRALCDTFPERRVALARLEAQMHRRGARYRSWADLTLEALEVAPPGGRFSALSRHRRRALMRQWWTARDAADRLVLRPRASDATAPESLAGSTAAMAARIRANQSAAPARAVAPIATTGPLATEVRRLRQLRGSALDLLDSL